MRWHLWTVRATRDTLRHKIPFSVAARPASPALDFQSHNAIRCTFSQFAVLHKITEMLQISLASLSSSWSLSFWRARKNKFSHLEFLFQHIAGAPVKCHDNYLCMWRNGMGAACTMPDGDGDADGDDDEWNGMIFIFLDYHFLTVAVEVSTIVAAFRYFSHLTFALRLVRNEVSDTFFFRVKFMRQNAEIIYVILNRWSNGCFLLFSLIAPHYRTKYRDKKNNRFRLKNHFHFHDA